VEATAFVSLGPTEHNDMNTELSTHTTRASGPRAILKDFPIGTGAVSFWMMDALVSKDVLQGSFDRYIALVILEQSLQTLLFQPSHSFLLKFAGSDPGL
jgi:hypothetical protein